MKPSIICNLAPESCWILLITLPIARNFEFSQWQLFRTVLLISAAELFPNRWVSLLKVPKVQTLSQLAYHRSCLSSGKHCIKAQISNAAIQMWILKGYLAKGNDFCANSSTTKFERASIKETEHARRCALFKRPSLNIRVVWRCWAITQKRWIQSCWVQ